MSNLLQEPSPHLNPDIMATDVEADLTTTKLQLENDSLKRRLAKYATTLEELTLHAKREISSSARARDEALAAAGESVTLREAMSDMEAALADAHAQRDAAQNALQEASDRLRDAQETSDLLGKKVQQLSDQLEAANLADQTTDRSVPTDRERGLETKVREFEDVAEVLRTDLRARDDAVKKGEHRIRELEDSGKLLEVRVARAESAVQETESALRQELDQALKELGERNTLVEEMKKREKDSIDAREVVQDRDALRCNVNQLQEELEQSTEMLTRAAIDALGDKGRIRKLEEALGKSKEQLSTTAAEKSDRDSKISGLGQAVARLEKELDGERTSKRSLADQCHKYQMHIHEQEKVVAAKARAYEELNSDRNDRAFQVDRVSLELSNAKNALAKKESDFVNLSAEYEDVRAQLMTTSKDLEDRHVDVSTTRKELSVAVDEIQELKKEKERFKATISELHVSRRQLQDLSALAAEKDEELSTVKRWYTTLKTEAGESFREKKRLSDMLSDVSGDLKRANQELDILRNMRKDHEVLAARISHIGETSTRELSAMRQTQTEQATALAKNTVDEYTRRLEAMQTAAQRDIAATVANQLRANVMPQLMNAVDAKTKHMVQSLARHVESFTFDTEPSLQSKYPEPSATVTNANADSIIEPDTNVATAYGSGAPSESRSAPTSAFQSAPPSAPQSAIPSNFIPSSTDSPPVSVPDVSRVDSVEGSTAGPSNLSPEPSVEQAREYPVMSPVESPTGSPIEAQSEDGQIPREIEAAREIAVPALAQEPADTPESEPTIQLDSTREIQANPEPIPEPELEPVLEPSEPAPEPSEPTPEPSEPAPEPFEPAPEPSEPAPEPSEPAPEPSEPAPEPSVPTDPGLQIEVEQEDASRDMPVFEEVEATRDAPTEPVEEKIFEAHTVHYEVHEEGDTGPVAEDTAPHIETTEVAPEPEQGVEIGEEISEPAEAMATSGTEDISEGITGDIAGDAPEGVTEDVAEDVAEEVAEEVAEGVAEDVAEAAEEEGGLGTGDGAVEELDLTEDPQEDMHEMAEEDYEGGDPDAVYGEAIIEELDDHDKDYIHGMPADFVAHDDEEEDDDKVVVAEAEAEVIEAAEALESTGIVHDMVGEVVEEPADEAEYEGMAEPVEEPAEEPAEEPSEEPLEEHDTSPEPAEEPVEEADIVHETDMGATVAEDKSDDMGIDEGGDMGLDVDHHPDVVDEGEPKGLEY